MAEREQTCAECEGLGEKRVRVLGLRQGHFFCRWQVQICTLCGGMGLTTAEQAEARRRGERLRRDRIARRVSLRAEAERLGVTPQELSRREWGRS